MEAERNAKSDRRIAGREIAREFFEQLGKAAESLGPDEALGFWLEMAYFIRINTPEHSPAWEVLDEERI